MSGLYVPMAVDWDDHPKVLRLRQICGREDRFERAESLYWRMVRWSKKHLTDGQVPHELHASRRQVEAKSWLSRAGLVEDLGETWLILGFTERNDTREEVEQKRARWVDKKRKQRAVSPGDSPTRDRDRGIVRDRERENTRAEVVPFREVYPAPDPEPDRDPIARLAGGYEDRFVRATGSPWMALAANHRWVSAVARWLEAQDGDYDANAARWLDAWFSHEPSKRHRWAWKFIAEDPGRVFGAPGERAKSADELIAKYGRGRANA